MPRRARIVIPGLPHHITQRGNNRQAVFLNDGHKRFYLSLVRKYASETRLQIWAYCLMPNHVHFIAVPEEKDSLAHIFHLAHTHYARFFNDKTGHSGHLWQGRFFSCVMETGEYIRAGVRYVERNPVRSRLAQTAEEYPWSSARAHIHKLHDPILALNCPLPEEITDWRSYLAGDESAKTLGHIRMSTTTGKPYASEEFLKRLEVSHGLRLLPRPKGRPKRAPVSADPVPTEEIAI